MSAELGKLLSGTVLTELIFFSGFGKPIMDVFNHEYAVV